MLVDGEVSTNSCLMCLHSCERSVGWQLTKSRSIQMPRLIVCRTPLFIFCMDPMFRANHLPSPSEYFDLEYDTSMWDSPCVSKILVKFREWVVCSVVEHTGARHGCR